MKAAENHRRRRVFGQKAKAAWAALTLAALAACQTANVGVPKLTLEEAKKVTAQFSGSFTPPPKSTNDIMARVDDSRSSPSP